VQTAPGGDQDRGGGHAGQSDAQVVQGHLPLGVQVGHGPAVVDVVRRLDAGADALAVLLGQAVDPFRAGGGDPDGDGRVRSAVPGDEGQSLLQLLGQGEDLPVGPASGGHHDQLEQFTLARRQEPPDGVEVRAGIGPWG
jgi:hypothetical protein